MMMMMTMITIMTMVGLFGFTMSLNTLLDQKFFSLLQLGFSLRVAVLDSLGKILELESTYELFVIIIAIPMCLPSMQDIFLFVHLK
jgi:hypothetical protein